MAFQAQPSENEKKLIGEFNSTLQDKSNMSGFDIGYDSLNFSKCLRDADENIEKITKDLDESQTADQILMVLNEILDKVHTKQELLDSRFDMSNSILNVTSESPVVEMQRGILTTGRKTTTKKNRVTFQQLNHSDLLNDLAALTLESPKGHFAPNTPIPKRVSNVFRKVEISPQSFTESPLFAAKTSQPVKTENLLGLSFGENGEQTCYSDKMDISRTSSMEDFEDALEQTEFANEDDIRLALERSRLENSLQDTEDNQRDSLDGDISTISNYVQREQSRVDQSLKIASNAEEIKILKDEIEKMKEHVEKAEINLQQQSKVFNEKLLEQEGLLKSLLEERNDLEKQIKQREESHNLSLANHLNDMINEVDQQIQQDQFEELKREHDEKEFALRERISTAENQVQNLKQQIVANDAIQEKYTYTLNALEEKDTIIQSLFKDKDELNSKLNFLKKHLDKMESSVNEQKTQLEVLKKDNQNLGSDYEQVKQQLDNAKRDKEATLAFIQEQHSKEMGEIRHSLLELQNALDRSIPQDYVDQLKKELIENRRQILSFDTEITRLNMQKSELESQINKNLNEEVNQHLNSLVDFVQENLEREEINELKKMHQIQLRVVETKLSESEKVQDSLKQEILQFENIISTLNDENKLSREKIAELEKRISSKPDKTIESYAKEVQLLNAIIDEEKCKHLNIQEELKKECKQQVEENEKIFQLNKKIKSDLTEEVEKNKNQIQQIEQNLNQVQKQFNDAVLELTKKNAQIEENEKLISSLQAEKQKYESMFKELEESSNKLRSEMEQNKINYNKDIDMLNGRMVELTKERNMLSERKDEEKNELLKRISELQNILEGEKHAKEEVEKQFFVKLNKSKEEFEHISQQKDLKLADSFKEMDSLREKLHRTEQLLVEKDEEREKMSKELSKELDLVSQTLNCEKKELKEQISVLQSQITQLQNGHTAKLDEVMKEHMEIIEQNKKKMDELINANREKEENFLRKEKEQTNKINVLEAEKMGFAQMVAGLNEEIADFKKNAREQEAIVANKISDFEQKLIQANGQDKEAKEKIREKQEKVNELEKQLGDLKERMSVMVGAEEMDKMVSELKERDTQALQQQAELKAVMQTHEHVLEEYEQMKQKHDGMTKRMESLNDENRDLRGKLELLIEMQEKTTELELKLKEVHAEKNSQAQQMAVIKEKLGSANNTLKKQLETIQLDNLELISKFNKFEEENELLNAELRLERSNNEHLTHQMKFSKQLKSFAEKEKNDILRRVNEFINQPLQDNGEIHDFMLELKDRLNKNPEEGPLKRPSGKAFLLGLAKKN